MMEIFHSLPSSGDTYSAMNSLPKFDLRAEQRSENFKTKRKKKHRSFVSFRAIEKKSRCLQLIRNSEIFKL